MAIGRPISLTPNIATKNISSIATADQTEFTVTGGYRINEIAVYRNGVRLAEGRDFTASDGDTVSLVTGATVDDVIEFAVFDSFNVSDAIVSAASSQNLNGDFNVTGVLYSGDFKPDGLTVGVATVSSALHVGSALTANAAGDVETIGIVTAASFSGDGSALTGVASTDNIITGTAATFRDTAVSAGVPNVNIVGLATVGIITAYGTAELSSTLDVTGVANFASAVNVDATTDSTSSTTGALIVDGGLGVAKNVYIGAGLSVAGTLTYEDVTNVDSVGLITAKSGVNVSGGQVTVGTGITMGIAGVATFSGTSDVHLTDGVRLNIGDGSDLSIYHDATNSRIVNGTGQLSVAGDIVAITNAAVSENLAKFTADGAAELYYNSSKKIETTNDGTVTTGISTVTGVIDAQGYINLAQKIIHTGDTDTSIEFDTNTIKFETGGSERIRIDSSGRIIIGHNASTGEARALQIVGTTADKASVQLIKHSADSSASKLDLTKSRNGTIGSNTVVQSGDNLGEICWRGDDGSDLNTEAVRIGGYVDGTPGSNDMPGRLVFETTADGSGSPTERLRITSTGAFQFSNGALTEKVNITAGKLSDNADIDLADGMIHYFTTQETTTSTPNIRVNSSISLNDIMTAGDAITVTVITTTAAAGYSAHMTIDSQTITEEWVGGTAPSAGSSDGLDIYAYTIICTHASNTGDSGFKVIANLTNAT